MKKLKLLLPVLILVCIVAYFAGNYPLIKSFEGTVTRDEKEFIMEYSKFNNVTYSHSFKMNKGDTIQCDVDNGKGRINITIDEKDGTRQYKGESDSSGSFSIITDRDCTYIVKVSGKRAAGSVKFNVIRN